jgi:hypothetical protein
MELRADIPFHKGFRGVTKDSSVSLRPLKPTILNDYLQFLGDFETALAVNQGPGGGGGGFIDEKRVENLVTLSL